MVFTSSFLINILDIFSFILQVYSWIIIGRVIVSWVNADTYNPIVRFIYDVTEPVMGRIRRFFPISFSGLDFSPVIVFIGIWFVQVIISSMQDQIRYWVN
ncbi:MAG: hypothetical protein CSA26_04425 [Desulfobacterales bacterium]|nr:MAG: hypothetical protein CSA26_04425 [Desulfobacterales bacterium]